MRVVGRILLALLLSAQSRSDVAAKRPLNLTELKLPAGFAISIYAQGLGVARMMAFSPDGTLYVSDLSGRVLAIPAAGQVQTFASGLNLPHGLAFRGSDLYVANNDRIIVFRNAGLQAGPQEFFAALPAGTEDHVTRTIVWTPDGRLIATTGSTCNLCEPTDPLRPAVLRFNADGSGMEVLARGLRNAVGLAVHPVTGEVWASDNEADGLGDDIPPDEIDIIRAGADYGWPHCYGNGQPYPGFTGSCSSAAPPELNLQAHSAPLGMGFYTGGMFPAAYRNDAFVAFHGSWNRTVPTGYKVVRVIASSGRATGIEDFLTGFLQGMSTSGRPVDAITGPDGALYVTDDSNGVVYRISYAGSSGPPATVIGSVDSAGDANGVATVTKGGTLYVRGWAADTSSGAPVRSVTVLVDGSPVGAAALGSARPDVAQGYGRSDYTNSGWTFQMSTGALNAGTHNVTASASGTSGTAQLGGAKTVNITSPTAGGQVIGYVDQAGDVNAVTTVTRGGTLYVRGWAADTSSGAPVQSVTIFLDGSPAGTATLGSARPDVAQAFGRSDFTNSGWSFQMSTGALNAGTHTVTASASGASGTAQLGNTKSVNITGVTGGGQVIGYLDQAGDVNAVPTVTRGGTLYVRGWAADTSSGAPVQSVTVYVDGSLAGTAALGSARPDVAQAFGRSDYTSSGWTFQMSTAALNAGTHTVTASASGASGTAQLGNAKTVNITGVTGGGQVVGFVDSAGDANTVATVAKGGTLYVRGWAADTSSGAPVQSVTISLDGSPAGTATLGSARPDVTQAFGRSDFTNSGWVFQISTGTLNAGTHTVTASASGASGTAQLGNTKTITITGGTSGGQVIGYVDQAGDVNAVPTVTKAGTLYVRGWAADTSSGAPVRSVTVFVDGSPVGTAALGSARPDVAQAFSRSDYTNSGWTFQVSATFLSAGTHTVTATASGTSATGQLGNIKIVTAQ